MGDNTFNKRQLRAMAEAALREHRTLKDNAVQIEMTEGKNNLAISAALLGASSYADPLYEILTAAVDHAEDRPDAR